MLYGTTRLTVVIWDRVGRTLAGRVDPILDYMLVELLVALLDEAHSPTVGHSPEAGTEHRPDEVAQSWNGRIARRNSCQMNPHSPEQRERHTCASQGGSAIDEHGVDVLVQSSASARRTGIRRYTHKNGLLRIYFEAPKVGYSTHETRDSRRDSKGLHNDTLR